MPARDELRIDDILQAGREAMEFVEGKTREDLDTDRRLLLALVKLIEIIGEAASHVSHSISDTIPFVPWPELVGIRNRLVSAHFSIDADLVWSTVTVTIPELIKELTTSVRAI